MLTRSAGTKASAIIAAAAGSPSSSRRRRTACWTSSSVSTVVLIICGRDQCVGVAGFADQHIERRHIGVPLDQGGYRAEPAQRFGVQRPNIVDDTRTVIVDPQGAAVGEFA